ncbi:MAG: hypothetical protein K2X29_05400 [Candidatus Obscuribacterales bacterium]|nr:hypothetical protein [Candidatus Obscuribacterales bacterium]
MPITNTYFDILGQPPAPNKKEFLIWVDAYLAIRKSVCTLKRPTTYYIDPVNGLDTYNGSQPYFTSGPNGPYKTLTPIRTRLTNNENNFAVLFKRGTTHFDNTGILLNQPNTYWGSYGTGSRPIWSNFMIQLKESDNPWTLATGNRYTASLPVNGPNNPTNETVGIGWLREVNDPLNPYTVVDTTQKVESTPFSFAFLSNQIHLNPGTKNPNDIDFECVPRTIVLDGIQIQNNAANTWINDLRFDGYGCIYHASSNVSGVRNLMDSPNVIYISNCESYYNGRHALSQEPDGNAGIHIVESCTGGYCSPIFGSSLFNSYCSNGTQECVWQNCNVLMGDLPCNVSGFALGQLQSNAAGFFGHTGNGAASSVGLYLNIDCSLGDDRARNDRATILYDKFAMTVGSGGNFFPGTIADPSSYRVYVINYTGQKTKPPISTQSPYIFQDLTHFINCQFFWWKVASSNNNIVFGPNSSNAYFQNCIFNIFDDLGTGIQWYLNSSQPTVGPRFVNCAFFVKGDSPNEGFYFCNQGLYDRLRLANCLFIGDRYYDQIRGTIISISRSTFDASIPVPKNDTVSARYCAFAGCRTSNTGSHFGFSNTLSPVFLNGVIPPTHDNYNLMIGTDLFSKGNANPYSDKADMLPAPEFDFNGKSRWSTPSIGPWESPQNMIPIFNGGGTSHIFGVVFDPVF